jgi:DNA polymerase III epsilon subunit-like protein
MAGFVFIDTETTGFGADTHEIVEIAVVGRAGKVLLNTLVNPRRTIPYYATAVHGITDDMVCDAPTLRQLWPDVKHLVRGSHAVIYNAAFDRRFFPDDLRCAADLSCAMHAFSRTYADRHGLRYVRKNLEFAATHINYEWVGERHRALSDAFACRALWQGIPAHFKRLSTQSKSITTHQLCHF